MPKKNPTLDELKELLRDAIDQASAEIKNYWRRGERSASVCIECNIDKAQAALEGYDPKKVKLMTEILNEY
jgi:predicted transcriptional regulator of viral defense system